MGIFLRYLLAMGIQMAWQRAGRGGATPPVRVPFGRNKGRTMPLPIIGPWQMMAAMWIARRIWAMYGGQVKSRLRDVNHPIAGQIHDLLPDTSASPGHQPASASQSTPAAAQAPPQPASSAQPQPAPQYGTQRLDPTASNGNTHATTNLPSGSVLNGLRGNG